MNIAQLFGSLCAAAVMAVLSAPGSGALRLVQYNAEWLFVNHYSQFDCPGTQCTWKNVSEAETHLSYVARVVDYLTPDIVNFCEVEGIDELQMVADLQVAVADYTPYLIAGTDTATGQNVGMLSRIAPSAPLYRTEEKYAYPIPGSRCGYTGAPATTGVSKHYITEFSLWENLPVALISAHLIAIPTDPARCAQREAQATILRKVVDAYLEKQYGVIVIGDMNDYDGEVLDVNQNIPKSGVLDILKGIANTNTLSYDGGPSPDNPRIPTLLRRSGILANTTTDDDDDNATTLYSVGDRLLPMERYSDWWDSDSNCNTESVLDYSMIDHILVSPNIQKYITNVFVYHGYAEYCGKYDSDHFPVVVDFAEPASIR